MNQRFTKKGRPSSRDARICADRLLAEDVGEVHRVIRVVRADLAVVAEQARPPFAVQGPLADHVPAERLLLDLRQVVVEPCSRGPGTRSRVLAVLEPEAAEVPLANVARPITCLLQQLRQGDTDGEELAEVA